MDKTWAWVSLIPTFGICFISGVLQFASGLIRQTLLQNVENGDFQYINWICSVYSGFYNLLGPLSSVFVYKMGCRKTVLIGGTIETLGFTSSFFRRAPPLTFADHTKQPEPAAQLHQQQHQADQLQPAASGRPASTIGSSIRPTSFNHRQQHQADQLQAVAGRPSFNSSSSSRLHDMHYPTLGYMICKSLPSNYQAAILHDSHTKDELTTPAPSASILSLLKRRRALYSSTDIQGSIGPRTPLFHRPTFKLSP
ncbi:unnamed protein product [Acanthosepion pharaonis]|uniref:Uncharacterized protein n=1 Tax=Acanthosepion pharaonis TaxID=158019 RepID=A0A812DC84_ACAPH|nr:unnamed protein product [Sepia pharaonis]